MSEKDEENNDHFRWISKMSNRIISQKRENSERPLLCLSFASSFLDFSEINDFPDNPSIVIMSNGLIYCVLMSIFNRGINLDEPVTNFQSVIDTLLSIGYRPCLPCNPVELVNGSKVDHNNLCSIIEYAIYDKAVTIDMFVGDLKRIPRSFFVLETHPHFIEEAISLWVSKFPCIHSLPLISNVQTDIPKGFHIAGILSRSFSKRIEKSSIIISSEISDQDVESNWALSKPLLDELGVFVPMRFPAPERLMYLFITDIFFATRPAAKRFVHLDPPPPPVVNIKPLDIPKSVPKITVPLTNREPAKPMITTKKVKQKLETRPSTSDSIRKQVTPSQKSVEDLPPVNSQSDLIRRKEELPPVNVQTELIKKKEDIPIRIVQQLPAFDEASADISNEDTISIEERPKTTGSLKATSPNGNSLNSRGSDSARDNGNNTPTLNSNTSVWDLYQMFSANDRDGVYHVITDPEPMKKAFLCLDQGIFDAEKSLDDFMKILIDDCCNDNMIINNITVFFEQILKYTELLPMNLQSFGIELLGSLKTNKLPPLNKNRPRVSFVQSEEPVTYEINEATKVQTRETKTIPNYLTIINALRFHSIPSPAHEAQLKEVIECINQNKTSRILLLLSSRTIKFKGVYILDTPDIAKKIWGKVPENIHVSEIKSYYKFMNGTKTFDGLSVQQFTQTTDAFSMIQEPSNW